MTLLFIYLFSALFISSLCSIVEAVLLSAPMSYLNVRKEKGEKSAALFVKLKDNIDRPISAILTLNTISHTVGAAGVGAEAVRIFGEAYFGLISAILTFLILVFSEIIPKTIGANYWKSLCGFSAYAINTMIMVTYPLVYFSEHITKLFANTNEENTVSREEISFMANVGTQEGVFGEKENKIIQNLIKLKSVRVNEIMTPRVVVVSANEDMPLEAFLENKDFLRFSRIPIFASNTDDITGYVFREEVFEKLAEDQTNLLLKDIKREIAIVINTKPLFNVWEFLLEKKEHIAVVIDEYGGMDGVVTMEDIVESLLGLEIVDETDKVADMREYARERWEIRQKKYTRN